MLRGAVVSELLRLAIWTVLPQSAIEHLARWT